MELAAETTSGLEAAGVLADGEYEPPALFIFSTTTPRHFFFLQSYSIFGIVQCQLTLRQHGETLDHSILACSGLQRL